MIGPFYENIYEELGFSIFLYTLGGLILGLHMSRLCSCLFDCWL